MFHSPMLEPLAVRWALQGLGRTSPASPLSTAPPTLPARLPKAPPICLWVTMATGTHHPASKPAHLGAGHRGHKYPKPLQDSKGEREKEPEEGRGEKKREVTQRLVGNRRREEEGEVTGQEGAPSYLPCCTHSSGLSCSQPLQEGFWPHSRDFLPQEAGSPQSL